ncbi:MAG: hypothetical protein ABRQ39_24635 [Candidatus Eremiobacterota bacterium]
MFRQKNSIRGTTLLEIMLSLTIFSMISGLMFYIFVISSGSWVKVRKGIEINESAQVLLSRIEREIRGSSINSVETMHYIISGSPAPNDAISFLTAYDPNTRMTAYKNDSGEMNWKQYVIFYVDDDPKIVPSGYYILYSKTVDLGFCSSENSYPSIKISAFPYPPTETNWKKTHPPVNPMSYYLTASSTYISSRRTIARNITYLNFSTDLSSVRILVKTGKPLKPDLASSPPSNEKLELESVVVLRNK